MHAWMHMRRRIVRRCYDDSYSSSSRSQYSVHHGSLDTVEERGVYPVRVGMGRLRVEGVTTSHHPFVDIMVSLHLCILGVGSPRTHRGVTSTKA